MILTILLVSRFNRNKCQTYVRAGLQHVVTIPTRNWHEGHSVWVVANLLDVSADFFDNLFVSLLAVGWLSGIHLVDTDNQLFHTQGVGQKGMLTGLPVLGNTSLKLANTSSNDQDSTISLGKKKKKSPHYEISVYVKVLQETP